VRNAGAWVSASYVKGESGGARAEANMMVVVCM